MNSGIKVNDNNNRYYKKGIRDLLSNRSSWILVFVFGLIPNFKSERITSPNVNTNNPRQFRLVEIFIL